MNLENKKQFFKDTWETWVLEQKSLAEIVELSGLSENQINKLVKELTGKSTFSAAAKWVRKKTTNAVPVSAPVTVSIDEIPSNDDSDNFKTWSKIKIGRFHYIKGRHLKHRKTIDAMKLNYYKLRDQGFSLTEMAEYFPMTIENKKEVLYYALKEMAIEKANTLEELPSLYHDFLDCPGRGKTEGAVNKITRKEGEVPEEDSFIVKLCELRNRIEKMIG